MEAVYSEMHPCVVRWSLSLRTSILDSFSILRHFQRGNYVRMGFQTLLGPEKAALKLHFLFSPTQRGHRLALISVGNSYAKGHLYFIKV